MNHPFARLTPEAATAWLASRPQALLLDARDAASHALGRLDGSLRLDGRNHEALLLREPKQRPVFIYCYRGNASQTYARMFADFGFTEVADLAGGWEAWQSWETRSNDLPAALAAWLAVRGFADPHSAGAHGNTPLMEAAWRGEEAVVDALLAQRVSLTATNGDGNNALWLACVSNRPALVQRLAQAGVPIDHANATGATCLMYAASSSKPEIVRTLLALGADPRCATQDDFTALDMAADIDSLRLLRRATAPQGASA